MPDPPTGTFAYVFIPADSAIPIDERSGDKSGGLSDDFLAKEAKRYFFEQSGGAARAAAIDNATPEERKALAQQIRDQVSSASEGAGGGSSGRMDQLDDDALINIVRSSQASATCEILALTIPTPTNSHRAVSMYGADDARTRNLPPNPRATSLMEACGHSPGGDDGVGIRGDVFVGRCWDDEAADVWERVDFTGEDADPKSTWCQLARSKGGGGGGGSSGRAGAPSLSGMMNNAFGQGGAQATLGAGGEALTGDGYRWNQTPEEVELIFSVAPGTKAKYVKVNFGRRSVKVSVSGSTLVSGETGGDVNVEDCTYTIQDERGNGGSGAGGRELCVTLGKKDGRTWEYAVRK